MATKKGPAQTWQENHEYLLNLLQLVGRDYNLPKGWSAKDAYENASFTLLEKTRVNLIACEVLLRNVRNMEVHFLPVALVLRTVVTDIIIHRYLRTIFGVAGLKAVEQELHVIDCDFVRAMKKIFKVLSVASPNEEKDLDDHFISSYSDYLKPDGGVVDPKSLRVDFDIELKIASYKTRNNIQAPYTDREGGKIDFLADANRENLKYLYTYLAQFHHYTTRSSIFYKDPDFRRQNIKVCGAVIWLATSMMFAVYTDLFPNLRTQSELKELAEDMVGEEIPLSARL